MKKLLIIVDYQNDFVDGALGFLKAKEIEDGICRRIQEYKKSGDDIVFTLDTHYDNYFDTVEGKHLPIKHCIKDTFGHEIHGEVKSYKEGCKIFLKETFPSSELLQYLLDKDYEEIELCGVVTNICVISNAVICKAAKPNSRIIVNSKISASNDEKMENLSYEVMKNLHIEII